MRILGIDPGLQVTGYGIIDLSSGNPSVVEAGVIRSTAALPLGERLREIAVELSALIVQFRPTVVAIEELYSHYDHPQTAVTMGHARGVVFLKAAESGLPVVPYAATRVKKALTGNGRATKAQVQAMVRVTFGISSNIEPTDAADALAIAVCHARAAISETVRS